MLPMLGMAKQDVHKTAFASGALYFSIYFLHYLWLNFCSILALCKFSEAILYYCSNKEKAPDQSIEKSKFSTQIYAAYEILFTSWLKTSDPKLRQITIESIGHFVNLIATEKLESDINKIMPGLLNLYKRHTDHFVISQVSYFKNMSN